MFRVSLDDFEIYDVEIEIYLEDKVVQKQRAQAPKEMLMVTFMQTAQQIAQDKRPMKIRMTRPYIIYDNFEDKQKTLTNEVSFSNNAMIAFEEAYGVG